MSGVSAVEHGQRFVWLEDERTIQLWHDHELIAEVAPDDPVYGEVFGLLEQWGDAALAPPCGGDIPPGRW